MKARTFLATAFLAVATLTTPFQASAMSVRQYESEPQEQRVDLLSSAIGKIVADVAKVNPTLSKSIYDYFHVIPQGQVESPGLIAFGAELVTVENLAGKGKLDLDKVQIEGILLEIIKLDVMPQFAKSTSTSPPAQP